MYMFSAVKYWLEDRFQLGEENCSLPSWERVREEKKKCYPKGWPQKGQVTEVEAKVGVQELADHTVTRYP